jgi:adenylate kinase family enzyme
MRIAIVGSSGSGKSTLARRLSEALRAPHIELDAINWQADWKDLASHDPEEFARRVTAATAAEAWVIDGNYSKVLPIVVGRATHLIWLDYSRWVIMPRVIRRSLARSWSGQELWPGTGNTEDWRRWLDKDHPIRWAWDTFERRRAGYEKAFETKKPPHLAGRRLRHPREAEALVAELAREAA